MKRTKKRIIRLAIIGVGTRGFYSFGGMIAKRNDVEIVALADLNPVRMQSAIRHYRLKSRCYSSAEELFAHETPDGAIITTPDFTHEAMALLAIRRRIPVFIEKPMATTTAGCLRIIQAARKKRVSVAVGFNLRHVPLLKKAKELIEDGLVGRLMLIQNQEFYRGGRSYMARWHRFSSKSGGLWIHKGSHDFDIFNWWNDGGTPIRVSAFAGLNALRPDRIPFPVKKGRPVGPTCETCHYNKICPDALLWDHESDPIYNPAAARVDGYRPDICLYTSEKDTHDNGIALVEYDNNVRASHMECFACNFTDRRYTVVGDRGVLEISLHRETAITFRPRWGKDRIIRVPRAAAGGHGGSDPEMLDTFVKSLRDGVAHSSNARDGIRAVAVGQAAERSWRTHRMVAVSELIDLKRSRLT